VDYYSVYLVVCVVCLLLQLFTVCLLYTWSLNVCLLLQDLLLKLCAFYVFIVCVFYYCRTYYKAVRVGLLQDLLQSCSGVGETKSLNASGYGPQKKTKNNIQKTDGARCAHRRPGASAVRGRARGRLRLVAVDRRPPRRSRA